MNIIDMHCDTILNCFSSKKDLHSYDGHINLENLKNGGCLAQCFALFILPENIIKEHMKIDTDSWGLYRRLVEYYKTILEDSADVMRPALSCSDIERNKAEGFISSILTIEDAVEIDGKMERFDEVYQDGVRMIALTWNFENCIGFPNSKDHEEHCTRGLKPFGIEAVGRMNELGIIVDVSHLSEAGFYDVAKYTKKPFVASHSCCRAIKDHSRNLTDDQLRTLADCGGIVGVNFYDEFLNDRGGFTAVEDVVEHVLHIHKVAGIDTIACGSDFDGMESELEFKNYSGYPMIMQALEKHFTQSEIDKISHGNFLRVFEAQK